MSFLLGLPISRGELLNFRGVSIYSQLQPKFCKHPPARIQGSSPPMEIVSLKVFPTRATCGFSTASKKAWWMGSNSGGMKLLRWTSVKSRESWTNWYQTWLYVYKESPFPRPIIWTVHVSFQGCFQEKQQKTGDEFKPIKPSVVFSTQRMIQLMYRKQPAQKNQSFNGFSWFP